ncbi:MAG: hemolysin III family protein, partial [Elusimicrobiota bacterium]
MTPDSLEGSLTLEPLIEPPRTAAAAPEILIPVLPVDREVPEIWSGRLSALGAVLSIPAIASLLIPALRAGSSVHIISFIIYGIGLLSMFTASAAFHFAATRERSFLKNLDYSAIALMLTGHFTPFCAIALKTTFGYWILAIIWACALAAITLRLTRPELPKWTFITIYLTMGWLGMLIGYPILKALGFWGAALTILGGAI